ncbi:MAG: transglycosylase domain-containing protein [Candidatus Pacebacteria bacterium]|nr:transglycosylase domain-containing protein [Candidatus Paceibacterota bacterium]
MPKRNLNRKVYQKAGHGKWFFLLKLSGFAFVFFVFAGIFLFIYYAKDLPRPEKFTERQFSESTKIYDRTGQVLLYEIYGEEKRTVVPLDKIPSYLKEAIIATEDANFYRHFGIDLKGLARSILADLKLGSPAFGGSTIPQQLIRSTFLSMEKTAERKIREIILAIELDRRYSKDQILEWYLNQIPFGQNTYGVEAASQTYFKKSVSEITLAEAATLAALIKGPSYYSPYGSHKEELLGRKDYVLNRMVAVGFLSKEKADLTKQETLEFSEVLRPIKAPHFTLWVESYLEEKYGEDFLMTNGLKIYTSLDWEIQKSAETIIEEGVKKNMAYNANNGALVAIDPKTGEILAMVGSANWYATSSYPAGCSSSKNNCLFDPKFNVATGSPGRQPGSSFKPFVYATAFENGFNASTVATDIETNFGVWGGKEYIPQNYDGKFRGEITLRSSLAQSLNIPSIKVLYLAGDKSATEADIATSSFLGKENVFVEGLKNSIATAKEMGITTLNKPLSSYGPAIVLGGGEVKLLDMVSAYGVFAAEGEKIPPVSILKIVDSKGNIIEENKKTPQRVLEKNIARQITDILSDNNARAPMFGTRSSLYFEGYQVAVKTGTTQDYRDAWVIGYTPLIAVGVWAGNNDNSSIDRRTGAMIAAPMWHQFMVQMLEKFPKEDFTKPEINQTVIPS